MALSILSAEGHAPRDRLGEILVLGELSLYGEVRPVRGTLPIALAAVRSGVRTALVPEANAAEAALVRGLCSIPVRSLQGAMSWLNSRDDPVPVRPQDPEPAAIGVDFRHVKGHYRAKRALEIAAAGGHNLLMVGPPGFG